MTSITASELRIWRAFYSMQPWGDDRDDWRVGQVTAMLANIHRASGQPIRSAADFMWRAPRRMMTPEEWRAAMLPLCEKQDGKGNS